MSGTEQPSRFPGLRTSPRRLRIASAIVVALALVLLVPTTAEAQTTIDMDRFGFGNAFRPGGPVAMRLVVRSDLDEAVPGLIQWEIPNPDGDVTTNTRRVEIPGRGGEISTWLIGDLPSAANPADVAREPWLVRVFEYRDGARVREIASARVDPTSAQAKAVSQDEDLVVVIGPNPAGLDGYGPLAGGPRPGLNEMTVTIDGVEPGDIPDHWAGLEACSTIVWAANDPRYSPSLIRNKPSTRRALRDWLRRGGHLVILLPASGDPWQIGEDRNVLGDLLSDLAPERETDYPLSQALPALSDTPDLRRPDASITLRRFDPETLGPNWRPLAGFRPYAPAFDASRVPIPEGTSDAGRRVLVDQARAAWPPPPAPVVHAVRRDVDHGTLDVIGIDVSDPDLRVQQASLLPKAWIFWNPILGRSPFTVNGEAVRQLKEDRRLQQTAIDAIDSNLVSPFIALTGAAASGVGIGLLLFAAYWLLAGPVGFAILKRTGKQRHAWAVFCLVGLVFAVVAWLLGAVTVGGGRELQHLTVLTHVYAAEDDADAPALDHATCWFSTRLAGYGRNEVAVGDGGRADLLAHFSPPPPATQRQFLDNTRYDRPFDDRSRMSSPSRATSAEFVADWVGRPLATEDLWNATIKVDPDHPVEVAFDRASGLTVRGRLLNGTGATLEDVTLVVVVSDRTAPLPPGPTTLPELAGTITTGVPPNLGIAVSFDTWAPGDSVDLARAIGGTRLVTTYGQRNSFRAELDRIFQSRTAREQVAQQLVDDVPTMSERRRSLNALSLFGILPDPRIVVERDSVGRVSRFVRRSARSIDLSRRLGEPNLILTAFAEGVPCPVPIEIDGEERDGTGTVMLRWIHPLPVDVEALVPPRDERFDPPTEDGSPDAARIARARTESGGSS